MDRILLIIGLILAAVIVATGAFGLVSSLGIQVPSFGSSGPLATGSDVEDVPEAALPSPAPAAPPESRSPQFPKSIAQGKIRITSVVRAAPDRPRDEYIILRYEGSGSPVVISGWTVENTLGRRYPLPLAERIPFSDVPHSIRFSPGETVYVHTGASPLGVSFMENTCTGYLNQSYAFNPRLRDECPRPDVARLVQFKDACLRFLESNVGTCRTPDTSGSSAVGIGQECIDYINNNLNYNSCLNEERAKPGFAKGIWHLYLNRPTSIYRELHDRITLHDQFGLIVDSYQY